MKPNRIGNSALKITGKYIIVIWEVNKSHSPLKENIFKDLI